MALFSNLFQKLYVGGNKDDLTPEDMPKNRFGLFIEALGVRVGLMIRLNMLYFTFILPLLVWCVHNVTVIGNIAGAAEGDILAAVSPYITVFILGLIPCLALAGPPTAALCWVTREFAKDEHVWLWSDFKDAMKQNWKQSAGLGALYGCLILIFWFANSVYSTMAAGSIIFSLLQWILIILVALIAMSAIYTFPMCVTFEMKFSEIVKSGLYICVGKLPLSLLFSFLTLLIPTLLIVLMAYWTYGLIVFALYFLVWGFSFASYVLSSYTNSVFAKYIDDPADKAKAETKADDSVAPEDLL